MFRVQWLKSHRFVYILIDTYMHSQLIYLYNLQILAAKLGRSIIVWVITLYELVRPEFPYLFTMPFSYSSVRSIPESQLALSFDFDSDDKVDSRGGSSVEPSGTRSQYGYRSSSNSNCSSNCSISSSSSDSDRKTLGAGDLEADADSLMSRQSGLSTLGHMQSDGLKSVILL